MGLGFIEIIPFAFIAYLLGIFMIIVSPFKPKLGLYYLIMLIPFTNVYVTFYELPLGKDINDLLFVSIMLGWFISVRGEHGKGFSKNHLNKYMILLIGYSFISLIIGASIWGYSLSPSSREVVHLKNYIMMPILYFLTINLVKSKKEIIIIVAIMLAVLFVADFHYFQNIRYRTIDTYRKDIRNGGIFTRLGSNELAAFYAYLVFLPLGLMSFEKKKIKIIYIGIAAFTLYPLLFLFSRGGYAGVLAGLGYIGLRKNRLMLLGIVILALLWTTILPSAVIERIEMTQTDEGGLDHTASLRIEYWERGLEQFLSSPLFGKGFDSALHFRGSEIADKQGGDLHNKYIEILAEEGIIGLFIFLSIFYVTIKNAIWLTTKSNDAFYKGLGLAAEGSVVACFTTNMFGDYWSYLELSGLFFTLMALVMSAKRLVEKQIAA